MKYCHIHDPLQYSTESFPEVSFSQATCLVFASVGILFLVMHDLSDVAMYTVMFVYRKVEISYIVYARSLFFLHNIIKIVSSSAHRVADSGESMLLVKIIAGSHSLFTSLTVCSIEGLFDTMGVDFRVFEVKMFGTSSKSVSFPRWDNLNGH